MSEEKVLEIGRRIESVLKSATDPEVKWLVMYALGLLRAGLMADSHLQRLANPHFAPRVRLERAIEGEEEYEG